MTIEDFVREAYEPDVELANGEVVRRHDGTWRHGLAVTNVLCNLSLKYPTIYALPSLQVKTGSATLRLIDVCVPRNLGDGEVPFLVIEVLSEEDRLSSFWQNSAKSRLSAHGTFG